MKISLIAIKSFLGLDNLDIAIERQILLVAGPNASGKTSIAHALRFVLDDDLCRVEHKKNIKDSIREGAKLGSVSVSIAGIPEPYGSGNPIEYTRSAATGHFTTPGHPPELHPALRYCLDPVAFTTLSSQERRGFLYKLMGVKLSAADIIATLEARKHPPALIQHITINLRSGFPMAHAEMMALGRELKGRYRELTGENWGEIKSAAWSCEGPGVDPDAITNVKIEIARLDEDLAKLQSRQGALTERAAHRKRIMDGMEKTRRIAGEHES